MRIFLSYESSQRAIAEKIAIRLQRKHEVFFDRDTLQTSDAFDSEIREWIERKADLFIFLVSPDALTSGSYTVTELGFAKKRWKDPVGRVLPVLVEGVIEDIDDAYLTSINIFVPKGNVEAEVASEVARMTRRRVPRWVALAAAAIVIAGLAMVLRTILPFQVEQRLSGQILDLTTGLAIPGVAVELRRGSEPVVLGNSDPAGGFELSFSLPRSTEPVSATLLANHEGFESRSHVLRLDDKKAAASVTLYLLPKSVAGCRLIGQQPADSADPEQAGHGIVVGHFRLPGSDRDPDLSRRIAETLTYNINPWLQEEHVPTDVLPLFVACDLAAPQIITRSGHMAGALGADALIFGDVELTDGAYTVSTYVGDSHEIYNPPRTTVSEAVNLNRPSIAQLDAETRIAILTALIAGYEIQQRYNECVAAAVAAERIQAAETTLRLDLGDIAERKARCQERTENFALLGGAR